MKAFSQATRNAVLVAICISAICLVAIQSLPRRVAGQSGNNRVDIVSAASFAPNAPVAPDSIASIFGINLATRIEEAKTLPLPTELAGTTVTVGGQPSRLFFVSPNQINCLIPPDLALGQQPIVVRSGNGTVSQGEAQINPIAPGIFTADSSGRGRPAAQLLRVRNGNLIYENIGTAPIDLGPESEPVYLALYLTGLRRVTNNVRVFIGNNDVPAAAGAVGGFAGLDQVNALIPRNLIGRGRVNVSISVPGLALSNEVQIDIAGSSGPAAPQAIGFESAEVSAGEQVIITGSNFNPDRTKNTVRIGGVEATVLEASSNRLRVTVPYGAESGPVSVITENREGRSAGNLAIKTSLSGFVEDTRRQPLRDVTVRLRGANGVTIPGIKTTAEGLFSFKSLPNMGPLVQIEIDPTGAPQLGSLPFPALVIKKSFGINRDNYVERIPLQQESGPSIQVGTSTSFNAADPEQGGFAPQIATGGVGFNVQTDAPVQFPDGSTSGRITMTIVADSRTPVSLPPSEYSSSVVQLTPFNARLTRGGKLTFPNPERFPAGTQARLYRLVTPSSAQETGFVEVGKATVSADGLRIETAAGAIDTTSYYFVSLPRRSTTVTGRVVDSDKQTPIRGALVSSRGQTALTDGDGSFLLRSVLVNEGDLIAVEAGYLRPNGRVDRGQVSGVPAVIDNITTLRDPIPLTSQDNSRLPIVLAPDSLIINEGEPREVDLIAAHPDGGQIVSLTPSGAAAAFASLSDRGGGLYRLRFAPPAGVRGTYTLFLIAVDDRGQTVSYEIKVTVNGRPVAYPQTIITTQNQPVNFTLTGEDPEGYALSYIIVANPASGTLSGSGANRTYTPNPGFLGSDQIIFKVNDALVDSLEARVTIAVTPPANRPPVLNVPGPQTVTTGNPLNFTVTASDPDTNQTLTITAIGRPGGSNVTQTSNTIAQFSWTPTATQAGSYTVTFEVTDNGTPSYKDTKNVTITVTGGNRPPVANSQSVTTNEDTPVNITLTGSDPDGNALTYAILGNPTNGTLSGSGANRTYTPRQDFNGSDSFTFKVNDGALDSNIATVTITVNPVNDAPVLTVPGAQSANIGQLLSFNVTTSDVDTGQTLTLTATSLPSGANFAQTTATSGQFTWTPSAAQTGTFTVTFRATDNGSPSLSDSKTVSILVNNRAPIANAQSVTTNEDTSLSIILTGSDPDGNSLTYTIVSNPANGSLSGSGATRTYTPNLNFNGTDSFTFKANDGALDSNTAPVNITVNPVNDAPVLSVPGAQTVTAGQPLSFTVTASDVDAGQTLTLSASNLPGGATFTQTSATSGQFNWTPSSAQAGSYTITFKVSDNGAPSLSDSKAVNITVQTPSLQWMPSGLTGGVIRAFAVSGTTLIAGTSGAGGFRSIDNGISWIHVSGLTSGGVLALASSGTNIFAGTSGGGVFRSTDDGLNWIQVNNGLNNKFVYALVVSGTIIFAGTTGGGVFHSTNNGANWTTVNIGLTIADVNVLSVSGTNLFAGTNGGGVFRSTDNGANWTTVNNGLTNTSVYAFAESGANLFAGTSGGGVFRSTDNGASWTTANNGLTNTSVYAFAMSGTNLFAGTSGGVFRSTDNGANWDPINNGLTSASVRAFAVSGTKLFAGTFGGGVFVLDLTGNQ